MRNALEQRLSGMRLRLIERIDRVEDDLQRKRGALSQDAPDRATEVLNDPVLEQIGAASRSELARVDAALARLAAGWQLTCATCGTPIGPDRLRAVPHANECATCASVS